MTNAQGWVALGTLAAFAGILVTLVLTTLTSIRNELVARIDGLGGSLGARIDGVNESLGARIDGVNESLGARIAALDRDVQALTRRMFDNPT